jgi:putative redox protein
MIVVTLQGRGDCSIEHGPTGTAITSSKSAAFGGLGRSFSSTDLLAAALGSCIGTDIEPVAVRHGVPLESIRIEVDKDVTTQPKQVSALRVRVLLPESVDDVLLLKLERAASHCLVHRSLNPGIEVEIEFLRKDGAAGGAIGDPAVEM